VITSFHSCIVLSCSGCGLGEECFWWSSEVTPGVPTCGWRSCAQTR